MTNRNILAFSALTVCSISYAQHLESIQDKRTLNVSKLSFVASKKIKATEFKVVSSSNQYRSRTGALPILSTTLATTKDGSISFFWINPNIDFTRFSNNFVQKMAMKNASRPLMKETTLKGISSKIVHELGMDGLSIYESKLKPFGDGQGPSGSLYSVRYCEKVDGILATLGRGVHIDLDPATGEVAAIMRVPKAVYDKSAVKIDAALAEKRAVSLSLKEQMPDSITYTGMVWALEDKVYPDFVPRLYKAYRFASNGRLRHVQIFVNANTGKAVSLH